METGFTTRGTAIKDYPILCEWWKFWKWTPIPQEVLPDYGRNGIMVQYNGENVVAGFIYATSSPVLFHFEWIISNPEIKDRSIRKKAKQILLEKASDAIKKSGGKIIYTSLKNEALINDFEENGFVKGSTKCTEMIKSLY